MSDIKNFSVSALSALLDRGELSSRELTEECFKRIREKDGDLHAFISLCEENAIASAEEADKKRAMGIRLPLLGIPFAVKDNFCVEGIPATCGSKMLEHYIPPYTASAVKRLVSSGAVLVGKTNMDEFGMGSLTANSAFFTTKNPKDRERSAGGSSGGSAAAVAAELVPFALGSDTGGSVRQPAAFCGAVGLKPTYGRISRYGLVAFASSLDTVGAITKTVGDSELLLSVLSGQDEKDATSLSESGFSPVDRGTDLRGVRIGLISELTAGMSEEVSAAMERVTDTLSSMGAEIGEISLPSLTLSAECYYIISSCEASSNLSRFDGVRYGRRAEGCKELNELYVRSRSEGFGNEVKRRIMLGTFALSSGYYDKYYARANAHRERICSELSEAFGHFDLLISPTSLICAPRLCESHTHTELYSLDICTAPSSLAGIPSVSLPAEDRGGLPVGIQLMAPRMSEDIMLSVARAYEEVTKK